MDNTLLPCSEFYQQARDALFQLVHQHWPAMPAAQIYAILKASQHEVHAARGFDGEAFPRSLRLTLERVAEANGGVASTALRDEAWAIGANVFTRPYKLYPGVAQTLLAAKEHGHRLVLATKGDPKLQWEKKILPNGLDGIFHHIEVCLTKPPATLAKAFAIGDQGQGRPGWMIGDSLTDDIAGGHTAGLRTIWVRPTHEAVAMDPFRADVTPDHALERFADLQHEPPEPLPWPGRVRTPDTRPPRGGPISRR